MLMIGSRAARHWIPNWQSGFLDFDAIGSSDDVSRITGSLGKKGIVKECYPTNKGNTLVVKTGNFIYDFEIAWPGSSGAAILGYYGNDLFMDLEGLYFLKLSHRYKKNSPHFLKTMKDIWAFRKELGLNRNSQFVLPEWYAQREKETYTYQHPKLNTSSKEFFKPEDSFYVYDHDWIHEVVARGKHPAYLDYQVNGEQVLCSRDKFYNSPLQTRLNGVYEEACVLALERSQIPNRGKVTPKKSFTMALEKVCTSITSGWFREFAWENYSEVLTMAANNSFQYADHFFSVADTGRVKLFTGNKY